MPRSMKPCKPRFRNVFSSIDQSNGTIDGPVLSDADPGSNTPPLGKPDAQPQPNAFSQWRGRD